jgi:hypothetical protein
VGGEGTAVRRVSRDVLPPAASLTAFRDGAGKTVLGCVVLGAAVLQGPRRAGRARESSGRDGDRAFGAPFEKPVLVTSAGAFRIGGGGEEFTPIGGPAAPTSADLLSDSAGGPILEIRSGEGISRWNGQAWSSHRAGLLKGGIFVEEKAPTGSYSSLHEVGGKLIWEEGGRRLSLSSPRAGLALATAAPAPGGRLYVGTTGDGLFLFEP